MRPGQRWPRGYEKDEYQQHGRGRRRLASPGLGRLPSKRDVHRKRRGRAHVLDEVLVAGGVASRTDDGSATSPKALAMPSTVPVRMPGIAAGGTWDWMTSHWVAPRPYAPPQWSRYRPIASADDDHDRRTSTRRKTCSNHATASRDALESVDEHGEAEQADDRRHTGGLRTVT